MASPAAAASSLILLVVVVALSCFGAAGSELGYGYELVSMANDCNGNLVGELQTLSDRGIYGPVIPKLAISVSYETKERLHVKIWDAQQPRWEVPQDVIPRETPKLILTKAACPSSSSGSDHHDLKFTYTTEKEKPFGFTVTRQSTGEVLFNTSSHDENSIMVFEDQFIQLSTHLPNNAALYGLGESSRSHGFRLTANDSYTLWDADIPSTNADVNLYGSFPFYMEVRPDSGGSAHGVLFLNSDGMDIDYSGSLLKFKALGGIIDFYFFAGPSPVSVVQQYTQLVGRPAPMPYWSFGFQQCRWGYRDIADLQSVVAGYRKKGIPLDVIWNDIDYMDSFKDFTVDPVNYAQPRFKAFLDELHAAGQRYVLILDPGIKVEKGYSTYEKAVEADIFIKEGKNPYLAQVWPGPVYFPDFMNPKTHEFWKNEISEFLKKIPADGLWIDMNEVSNFCSGTECSFPENGTCPVKGKPLTECCLVCKVLEDSKWEKPLYRINNKGIHRHIRNKTMTPGAVHYNGAREYDTHNLYGLYETIATHKALTSFSPKKRPFILSRSTFVGSGAYAAHWTGDNAATWTDLKYSISTMLNFGIFGIPMVGADICGFLQDTTEELCSRWLQLGAFYPFSRQHSDNGTIRQEPYLWESTTVAAKKALGLRYRLLPYLYTLSFEAHMTGTPIARPLFFTFPEDLQTLNISNQFLLGRTVLVSPVLEKGANSVKAYFPQGTWYNLFDLSHVQSPDKGSFHTLDAPLDSINVHLFEGSIIPLQDGGMTTVEARKTPFTLFVAFPMQTTKTKKIHHTATGSLFLDDGEQMEMQVKAGTSTHLEFNSSVTANRFELSSKVMHREYALQQGWKLHRIVVLGSSHSSSSFTTLKIQVALEDNPVHVREVPVHATASSMTIEDLNLPIGISFRIGWDQK